MAILGDMQVAALTSILEKHIPSQAVPYCLQLWEETPFQLVLRKNRATKLGDFTCKPGCPPRITINDDSHHFQFLLTFVHEVAHLRVYQVSGFKVPPHGRQWKETFRNLCGPLFELKVFPESMLETLRQHLQNPSASSMNDANLSGHLQEYDERLKGRVRLADLPEGSQFRYHGKWFEKGHLRRTRILCRELSSRRKYAISAHVLIGET